MHIGTVFFRTKYLMRDKTPEMYYNNIRKNK